jgi:hypothetical protein
VHICLPPGCCPKRCWTSGCAALLIDNLPLAKLAFTPVVFFEERMNLKMKTVGKAIVVILMLGLFAAPVTMATAAVEEQPHMKSALEHLKLAKAELEQAEADKGGHRVAALKATNDAIHHTEEGIKFANHH